MRGRKKFICVVPKKPRRKIKVLMVTSAAASILFCTGVVILSAYDPSTNLRTTAGKTASEVSGLEHFHRKILSIDDRLSEDTATYATSRERASRDRDLIGLFDASNRYDAEMAALVTQANAVDLPRSRNASSLRWATTSLKILRARLAKMQAANRIMVTAVDSAEFSPSAFQAIEAAKSWADGQENAEDISIRKSYEAIGLSPQNVAVIRDQIKRMREHR